MEEEETKIGFTAASAAPAAPAAVSLLKRKATGIAGLVAIAASVVFNVLTVTVNEPWLTEQQRAILAAQEGVGQVMDNANAIKDDILMIVGDDPEKAKQIMAVWTKYIVLENRLESFKKAAEK